MCVVDTEARWKQKCNTDYGTAASPDGGHWRQAPRDAPRAPCGVSDPTGNDQVWRIGRMFSTPMWRGARGLTTADSRCRKESRAARPAFRRESDTFPQNTDRGPQSSSQGHARQHGGEARNTTPENCENVTVYQSRPLDVVRHFE